MDDMFSMLSFQNGFKAAHEALKERFQGHETEQCNGVKGDDMFWRLNDIDTLISGGSYKGLSELLSLLQEGLGIAGELGLECACARYTCLIRRVGREETQREAEHELRRSQTFPSAFSSL